MTTAINFELKDGQLLLFVDILGFSELIKTNSDTTMETQNVLITNFPVIFNNITSYYDESKQSELGIKFFWGSDTIVVSSDINCANSLLDVLAHLEFETLNQGILLRGAITYGKLFHEKNMWGSYYGGSRRDGKNTRKIRSRNCGKFNKRQNS